MERILRATLKNGVFSGVSADRSRAMSAVRGKGNRSTETVFRMALVREGIRGWTLHRKDLAGCPDFYFARLKVAVFIDGCFWHGCPKCGHIPKTRSKFWRTKIERNKGRDKRTNQELRRRGVKVLRMWEHELQRNMAGSILKLRVRLRGTR